MKTNEIYVSNQGTGREDALSEAEKYADYQTLGHREKMHIRILTEELLGMVEAIAGNFYAYYWIEDDSEGYHLHLEAKANMDTKKKDALIDASTSKQNNSARGVMGKLRDVFQNYWMGYKETIVDSASYYDYMRYGMIEPGFNNSLDFWSLSQYRTVVRKDDSNQEEWDELEKSIVANLADDVTVGIRGNNVELVITKKWKTGKE